MEPDMTDRTWRELGVELPLIMLPKDGTDMEKMGNRRLRPVYFSARILGEGGRVRKNAPSALRLILPEALLSDKREETKRGKTESSVPWKRI
jgi:hypothetical protein